MSIFSKEQSKKFAVNAANHGYKPEVVTFKQGQAGTVEIYSF